MTEPIEKNTRPGYLVVAPKAFHDELAPLIKERTKKYDVTLSDTESLYASHPAKFRHESIRQYVKDVYTKSGGGLKYLLIVGDDSEADEPNEIPIGIYPRDGNRAAIPSDAYYGDMQGDLWPELATGRIPAATTDDAARAVKKILSYERSRLSPAPLAFYGGQVKFGPIQDLLLEGLVSIMIQRSIPPSVTIDVHYDSPDSAFHTDKSFLQMLNGGPSILTYMGHGSTDALITRDGFDTTSLKAVDIKGGATILNLLACSAGCFADKDCLGEALVLHQTGPIAVIGSSEVVSPVLLYFFAGGMGAFMEHPENTTLGDVFLAAQRGSEDPDNLLWKIVSLLPPRSQDKLYLKPRLAEAAVRQALQMTLLGDPALTWKAGKTKSAASSSDPRQKIPRSTKPMSERVTITNAPTGKGLDSRSMQTEDLSSTLLLLDYLFYRSSELFDNYKELLPKAGEATVKDGIFSIPIHGKFALKDSQLNPSVSHTFFPQGASGTITIEGALKFGLRMTAEGLNIYSIEGVSVETPVLVPSKQTLSELKITFRPEPRLETVFLPSPLTDEELQALNKLLAEGSKGNSHFVRLEREGEGGEASFALYLQKPDSKEFVRALRLHSSLSGMRPIVTKAGIALPLPYGVLAHGIEKAGEGYRLKLETLPYGLKRQYYIYIPANPHDDIINASDAVRIDFEATNRLTGDDTIYELMALPGEEVHLPVYLAYPAESLLASQIGTVIGGASKGSASPFGERGGGAEGDADLGKVDWSGHLGAKICIAVDGSGSMGEHVEKFWPQLEKIWGKIPDFARSFVDIGIVTVSEAGFKEVLPLTPLSEIGMNGLLSAIDDIPFRGQTDQLEEGAKYCARLVEPSESGLIYRSAILLTDAEGDVKLKIGDATKLIIDKLDAAPENFILKPRIMQQLAAVKDASQAALGAPTIEGRGAALEALYQTIERFKEPAMAEAVIGAAIRELVKFDDPGLIRLVAPLTELALGSFDWPLKRDTIKALGVIARRGLTEARDALLAIDSKLPAEGTLHQLIADELKASISNEERAQKLLTQVKESPSSVQPAQLADCGPVDAAVEGLIRIARYSNEDERRDALVQLGIILRGAASDPTLKDQALLVKALLEELVDLGLEGETSSYILNTAHSIGIKWEM